MMSGGGAKNRKKKVKQLGPGEIEQPTKQEKEIAKYLRFNMKAKDGVCMGNTVAFFPGSRAVDQLLASKWAGASKKDDTVLFPNRQSCVDFLNILLEKDLFRRVIRIRRQKKDRKNEKEKRKDKSKKDNDTQPTDENVTATEAEGKTENKEGKKDNKDEKKDKKKKPAKLDPHEDQWFVDADDDGSLYIWIFDPISTKTWLMGTAAIIGAIAACLYPLWPMQLRLGIYYICLGMIGLLGLLVVLGIVRFILFCSVWVCSGGQKYFWLYPNLFADVGVLESFQPTYTLSTPSDKKNKKKAGTKTESKDEPGASNDSKPTAEGEGGKQTDCSEKGDFEVLDHSDFDQPTNKSEEGSSDE